jgi:hypothetical protein
VKRKLSIRKKNGGASIEIVIDGRDENEPVRSGRLNREMNTPLQMSELKTFLLKEYHSISSISKVECMIEEQMGYGPESYIGCTPIIIENDTDKIPADTRSIKIHTDYYERVHKDMICVLTNDQSNDQSNDQYSVDNTNYTLTIDAEIIRKSIQN